MTTRTIGTSGKALIESIFQVDAPEQFIRTFPAQSIYLALQQTGLASSSDLLLVCSHEQLRLILDFDLWQKDSFNEDRLWEWFSLSDDEDGLRILQKILACIDLKLIALLIGRHVDVVSPLEPTDAPPSPGFFTPDKGHTWIQIRLEDPDRHFHLGRTLAMLFETNADMFYQLLRTNGVATNSMLEEDSFQEKQKRLMAEGIPSLEDSAEINSALSEESVESLLARDNVVFPTPHIQAITPLLHSRVTPQPLASVLSQHPRLEDLELELTHVMNSCFVFFRLDFSDEAEIMLHAEKIKGAINIGLQRVSERFNVPPEEGLKKLGLRNLYRVGLSQLYGLRRRAREIIASKVPLEGPREVIIQSAAEKFPEAPEFFVSEPESLGLYESGAVEISKLSTTRTAILTLSEVNKIKAAIS